MAVMATDSKELNAAEEAYAAISRYDKVDYIQYIKELPNKTERLAEMALLSGDLLTAEGILLQNGLIEEAIRINIEVYNWNRALELAIRHKKQLDEVLSARKKYLQVINKKETNQSFLAYMANVAKAHEATGNTAFRAEEVEPPEKGIGGNEMQKNEAFDQDI